MRPFLPAAVATAIEAWAENYFLNLLELRAEIGIGIVPMFWRVAFGWDLASGYPWGIWKGGGYYVIKREEERFVEKTMK